MEKDGDNQAHSMMETLDQSTSEDSSLSDSDKTLVGDNFLPDMTFECPFPSDSRLPLHISDAEELPANEVLNDLCFSLLSTVVTSSKKEEVHSGKENGYPEDHLFKIVKKDDKCKFFAAV